MRKNRVGRRKNGFSMFILDDDKNMTDALQSYFEASGYTVTQSNDPLEALTKMQEKSYDILLLDFIMYPICGDEVVARLRKFDTNIYVIMLTGHREVAPPLNTIRELEIQGYFEKSDRFDQLELLVESCIKSIRQMKTVMLYQKGLQKTLEAVPKMNQRGTGKDFAELVLEQLLKLGQSKDGFVWIYSENMVETGDLERFSGKNFWGSGIWEECTEPEFRRQYPQMMVCLKRKEVSIYEEENGKIVLLPLKRKNGVRLGVMGVRKSEKFQFQADLAAVFAEQASSAIDNALLHMLLEKKTAKLQKAYTQLEEGYLDTVEVIRRLVDAKDIYTRGHSERVSYYARKLAEKLDKPKEFCERVSLAGLMHDIGKIGVPDAILCKKGRLTDEEFGIMKNHPDAGANILTRISMFSDISEIVRAHHERYDGSGYPGNIKGTDIPEEARIISIADAFDAMMSDRHYRSKLTLEACMRELENGRGTQFDGGMVDAFLKMLPQYEKMNQDLKGTY